MADDYAGRSNEGRGGFQRRNGGRGSSDRFSRGGFKGRGAGRDDERGYGRRDRFEDRGFNRPDRGAGRGFGRSDRQDRFDRGEDRGFGRQDRQGRGAGRGGYGRDRRSWGDGEGRDDRRRSSYGSKGGYGRGDDDSRGRFDRGGRDDRRQFSGRRDDRQDKRGPRRDGQEYQNYATTDEYVSPNPDEPTIPAGVSAEELDAAALRALNTLSGPNKDIVARHLVMAGQLIDLDPEEAYKHAAAASSRAGRVDVVREAAALTAYASGRYEEALREVRAVRRMRGDDSLRAVEADCERGLGHADRAVEIVEQAETKGMDLDEQVELVLVSSGARADLGQSEVGLLLVEDALAALPEDTDPFLVRRLMLVKAERLRELGREAEADEVEVGAPEEVEDPEIVDISLYADSDVDSKRSPLRFTTEPLCQTFDAALLDLDGTSWNGDLPLEHAADSIIEARSNGMKTAFVTNNAMRTPQQVADKLTTMGFEATPEMIMTSAMDVIAIMKENLEDGAKVFVIGGAGLREALTNAGYVIVESADDEPAAVVQGLDKAVDWALLSEGAFAIERGAQFFATNLDATLPQERGFALGNGSLVRAMQHATRKRPLAAGKPEPGIYQRGAELVGSENPIAVGDRLETDIMGAIEARMPALHVLTGVHGAREVVLAPRGQRPSFLALDMRGLLEEHPQVKHHKDGTWTCGVSQVAKAMRNGTLTLDGIELDEGATISLDSYRALAAAAWEYADEQGSVPRCPELTIVGNDDPAGTLIAKPESAADEISDEELGAQADELDEALDTPAFLPGEEELERLLSETADDEDDADDEDEEA